MRKLKAHEEIVGRAERLAMSRQAFVQQGSEAGFVRGYGEGLVRIGTAIGLNGGCFAAPNQLGATQTKISPAAERQLAR